MPQACPIARCGERAISGGMVCGVRRVAPGGFAFSKASMLGLVFVFAASISALGCGAGSDGSGSQQGEAHASKSAQAGDDEALAGEEFAAAAPDSETLDRQWPLHGLVTRPQLVIREEPEPEARILGWVRVGSRLRLKDEKKKTSTCASGWYPLHPRGWVCAGQGIDVAKEPPRSSFDVPPPDRDAPLPYTYFFVKETVSPQFHRLPLRSEQRATDELVARHMALLPDHEERATKLLAGELGAAEPQRPSVVARFLARGFFLAATGMETRDERLFARSVSGAYVRAAHLIERKGPDGLGVELGGERKLPIAFALRDIQPLMRRTRPDESLGWRRDAEETMIPRHTIVDRWLGRTEIEGETMHRLGDSRYAHRWFIGVAEKVEPPFSVSDREPWVHVDLSEQTLVLYVGKEPVFATLISTGLKGHDTPTGVFRIRRKLISDTMANLGPEAGDDRYRIEDVPWTQYFEGSVALHGAFWHSQFGIQRSHGCVNLAPADAHYIFNRTWPLIPDGWHGVSTELSGVRTSRVWVSP